jgi:TfoX/Sxy family transcriptional regulator of competence genes
MAYDEKLAVRVRQLLEAKAKGKVGERRMFGGLCFLLDGNMIVGVEKNRLMVRVGKAAYAAALARPHAREMDFTGKPMAGYVFVGAEGLRNSRVLAAWIARAEAFVATLPPKSKTAASKRSKHR